MGESTKILNTRHDCVRLMLDAMPFCCHVWNREGKIIDCNKANIEFFKLRDKQELIDNFFFFSPGYQPDGQRSDEKAMMYLQKAFAEGKCVFEWMHQSLNGTPLPVEMTLVRLGCGDDDIVAAYSRDLREQKHMMREIRRRDNLLDAVNRAAAALLRSEDDAIESDWRHRAGVIAHGGMLNVDLCDSVFSHKIYCEKI